MVTYHREESECTIRRCGATNADWAGFRHEVLNKVRIVSKLFKFFLMNGPSQEIIYTTQHGICRYSSENPRCEETVPALSSKLTWMRKGGPDSLLRARVRSVVSLSLQSVTDCWGELFKIHHVENWEGGNKKSSSKYVLHSLGLLIFAKLNWTKFLFFLNLCSKELN